MPLKIGTHSGVFHCDEAMACFMLKLLPRYSDATIVRSRDLSVLDTCDIVVDVGGVYDPETLRFDHHMREFNKSLSTVIKKPGYDSTIKLSSAGLVYCHFGKEIIKCILPELEEQDVEVIFKKVYNSLIKEIDAIDNGVPMFEGEPQYRIETHLSARVNRLNPDWQSKDCDREELFRKAMDMCGEEFLHYVNVLAKSWLPAKSIVREAIEKRFEIHESGEIIELEQFVPWMEHLYNLETELEVQPPLKYVIFKDSSYRVRAVPVAPHSFVCRLFLPEAWAGRRDAELSEVAGIDGCVFVHSVRFIGGNATRDGAIAMAKKALEIGKTTQ